MKSSKLLFLFLSLACLSLNAAERKQKFNNDWWFRNGGDSTSVYQSTISKKDWNHVQLPHDWSIELGFSKENSPGGIATGHTQGGIGWYKKNFTTNKSDQGKIISIYFEGAYMLPKVWLNGQLIHYQPSGYTSFICDLTKYLKPAGQQNTLLVKTTNEGKNSRWYAGAGIYRNVWMIETDKLHFTNWGTYIQTKELTADKAILHVSSELINETRKSGSAKVSISIFDKAGKKVAVKNLQVSFPNSGKTTVNEEIKLPHPTPWTIDHPELYTAELAVKGEGRTDKFTIPFGVRTLSFSTEKGFLLNGKQMKLKGGCVHHDNGFLGSAAIDRAEDRKVQLLKENGFNAVRCSHNPPSEEFLNACDRRGLLVVDEAFDQWEKEKNPQDYHLYFDQWWKYDLTAMVLRDRNHPSVIMWSIGNEIKERSDSSGMEIAKNLRETVKKYDKTRPVTMAVNFYWDNPNLSWKDSWKAFKNLDVAGYNYAWRDYVKDHEQFPERVIFSTETLPMDRALAWDYVEKYSYVIGDFVWTAMDYLGESGIGHTQYTSADDKNLPLFPDYPWFNGWCGDIDLCGNPKPQSTLRKVAWNDSKIEMLVHAPIPEGKVERINLWGYPDEYPSWNWKGQDGKNMTVKVITKYPEARLYLNGQLIGDEKAETYIDKYSDNFKAWMDWTNGESKEVQKKDAVIFQVPYHTGTLKAVGVENGIEKESTVLKTTGDAYSIRLLADRSTIQSTPDDLAYINIELVDKDGNPVTDKDVKLSIQASGPCQIAGSGNACPYDMDSFRTLTPKTYLGKAMVIVRPTGKAGIISVNVTAEGLKSATANITIK